MLCKCPSTDATGERSLPTVCLQVNLKVTRGVESLPTEPAAVWPVHGVVLLVRAQLSDGAKSLATKHTRARYGGHVSLKVFAQRVHAGLRAATRYTHQWVLARVRGFLVHL